MTLDMTMNQQDQSRLRMQVDTFNKSIAQGRTSNKELGKDDFIKILLTQLQHQDPTAPMEDKEFIAQMAQFSSLEQMTNMAADFAKLSLLISGGEAIRSLGKSVEIQEGEQTISGTVKAVTRTANPEILVDGKYYAWDQVTKIVE